MMYAELYYHFPWRFALLDGQMISSSLLLTLVGSAFIAVGIGAIIYFAATNSLSISNYFAMGFIAMPPIGAFLIILDTMIAGKSWGLKHGRNVEEG